MICIVFSYYFDLFKNFYSWFHIGLMKLFQKEVKKKYNASKVMYSSYAWIRKYNTNYLREVVSIIQVLGRMVHKTITSKNELIVFLFTFYFIRS